MKKKKIAVFISIAILSASMTVLCGCGSDYESQFDESTNQHVSAFGISLKIPSAWDEKIEGEDIVQYYEGNDVKNGNIDYGINISLTEEETLDDAVETLKWSFEVQKEEYRDVTDIVFKEDYVADSPAVIAECTRKYDGKKYKYAYAVFKKDQDVLAIEFLSIDRDGIGDFYKILESISFEE